MGANAGLENAPGLKARYIHCIHRASSLMSPRLSYMVTKPTDTRGTGNTFFEMAQACGPTHLIFGQAESFIGATLSTTLIVHTAFMLVPRSDLAVSQL